MKKWLDKEVDADKLVHKYKDPTADVKFDEFDNALIFVDDIRKGEIDLVKAKDDQNKYKSKLNKTKRGKPKNRSKKALYTIINCFTKQGTVSLSSWMMIF